MEIKDLIHNQRIKKNLTMRQLADMCQVSEGTVSRWESGNIATMKQTKIALLCKALDISPAVFCETDEDILSASERTLIEDFRSLSQDGQRDLLRYLRMLKADEEEQTKKEEKVSG